MTPETIDPSYATMVVFVGLSSILSVVSTVVAIISNIRRKPPVQEEMYKEYARVVQLEQVEVRLRQELLQLTTRYEKTIGEVFRVCRELKDSTEKALHDMSRMVGRLEGALEQHTQQEHK